MKRIALLTTLILAGAAGAQMEKRLARMYKRSAFEKAAPALGTVSPDLILADTEGRWFSFGEQLGRTVVMVKGART